MHLAAGAMRDDDTDRVDPKNPHPVPPPRKKGTNPLEGVEGMPWRHLTDLEHDRHRHL